MTRTIAKALGCIYCGSKDGGRTDEHVVAEALNGGVVIDRGSCGRCQVIINQQIEDPLLSLAFNLLRTQEGYVQKKRRKKGTKVGKTWNPAIMDPKKLSKYNSVAAKFNRIEPPFQFVERIALPWLPAAWHRFRFPIPGFMRPENGDLGDRKASFDVFSVPLTPFFQSRLMEICANRSATKADLYELPDPVPRRAFIRLIYKIACGFFFVSAPRSLAASRLGQMVVGNEPLNSRSYLQCSTRSICDRRLVSESFSDRGRRRAGNLLRGESAATILSGDLLCEVALQRRSQRSSNRNDLPRKGI